MKKRDELNHPASCRNQADAPIGYGVLGWLTLGDIQDLRDAEFIELWTSLGAVIRTIVHRRSLLSVERL